MWRALSFCHLNFLLYYYQSCDTLTRREAARLLGAMLQQGHGLGVIGLGRPVTGIVSVYLLSSALACSGLVFSCSAFGASLARQPTTASCHKNSQMNLTNVRYGIYISYLPHFHNHNASKQQLVGLKIRLCNDNCSRCPLVSALLCSHSMFCLCLLANKHN